MRKTENGYELTCRLWVYGDPLRVKCRKPGVGMVDIAVCAKCSTYNGRGYRKDKGQDYIVCKYDFKRSYGPEM